MPDTQTPLARLREPFPPNVIGKLPKGGVELDFVGHAAVTDRLLSVDPNWTWEPMGVDPAGLPAVDSRGNLWIRLTVCGVTRIGVGDGKSAKECIGDAIRNAAMRFGVALDLWTKDELESAAEIGSNAKPTRAAARPKPATSAPAADEAHAKANRQMWALAKEKFPDETEFRTWIADGLGLDPAMSLSELTTAQMNEAAGHLRNLVTPGASS